MIRIENAGTISASQELVEGLVDEAALGITHAIRKIRLLFEAVRTSFELSCADEVLGIFRERDSNLMDKWSEFEQVIITFDRHSFVGIAF